MTSIKSKRPEKFLCLVYFKPDIFDRMTEKERRDSARDSLAYDVMLKKSGRLVHAEALQSVEAAACVQVRKRKVSMRDGPFAETREVLGGFILITARNQREALKLAAGIPLAKWGTVEVRPIYKIPA